MHRYKAYTANHHGTCIPQHQSTPKMQHLQYKSQPTSSTYLHSLYTYARILPLFTCTTTLSLYIICQGIYLQVVMYTRDNLVKMLCTRHMNCCVLHIHPSSVFGSLALQLAELCTLRAWPLSIVSGNTSLLATSFVIVCTNYTVLTYSLIGCSLIISQP